MNKATRRAPMERSPPPVPRLARLGRAVRSRWGPHPCLPVHDRRGDGDDARGFPYVTPAISGGASYSTATMSSSRTFAATPSRPESEGSVRPSSPETSSLM